MKVYTRDYRIPHIRSSAWARYFGGLRHCVFDIETTGLDPVRNKIIMTALLTETDDGVRITQFLAENHYEEEKVISATMDFLKREGIDYLITFNGARFDIPFVRKRMEKLIMPDDMNLYNLDLYRFIKKETILPNLMKSLRQKMVEEYFGLGTDRQDTITGRESVTLYEKFALTGDSVAEKIILTHNREDVLQLYRILVSLSYDEWVPRLKNGDFHQAIASYGMPVRDSNGAVALSAHVEPRTRGIRITGSQLENPISAAIFRSDEYAVDADFKATTGTFEITVVPTVYQGSIFMPLRQAGIDERGLITLSRHPGYCEGCLILKDGDNTDREAVNLLAMETSRALYERLK